MINVYYPNALVLAALLPEAVGHYRRPGARRLLLRQALFVLIAAASLFPTFLTKYYVYGHPFESGYIPLRDWAWRSPWFLELLVSANHGLFSWTPVLLLATVGMFLYWRKTPAVGTSAVAVLVAFYLFMAAYPDWAGISSYGNRFFVSLTAFFVLGLSELLETAAARFSNPVLAPRVLGAVLGLFTLWNLGLIFQWGAHLIPARGPVSWRQVVHNQFQAVPRELATELRSYLFRRKDLLRRIEDRDIEELSRPAGR